jgi:hypothetical protein
MSIEENDLKLTETFKFYPYIRGLLKDLKEDLNDLLYDNFSREVIKSSLFAERRRYHSGFNYSFAIEFVIRIFNVLNKNVDKEKFLLPELKEFLKEKNEIKIIE